MESQTDDPAQLVGTFLVVSALAGEVPSGFDGSAATLLLEDDNRLLLEDGGFILLEDGNN